MGLSTLCVLARFVHLVKLSVDEDRDQVIQVLKNAINSLKNDENSAIVETVLATIDSVIQTATVLHGNRFSKSRSTCSNFYSLQLTLEELIKIDLAFTCPNVHPKVLNASEHEFWVFNEELLRKLDDLKTINKVVFINNIKAFYQEINTN